MYLFKLRTTPIECTCSDNHTCEPCKEFIAHTNAMEDAGMFDPPTWDDFFGEPGGEWPPTAEAIQELNSLCNMDDDTPFEK